MPGPALQSAQLVGVRCVPCLALHTAFICVRGRRTAFEHILHHVCAHQASCFSPNSVFCNAAEWRVGGSDQPTAQYLQQQHQQHGEHALAINELDGNDPWPLESGALSPASYGSSSDCLADALVSTLPQYGLGDCGGGALDAAADGGVPWPPQPGSDPSDHDLPLPAQQQLQSSAGGSATPACGSGIPSGGLMPPCSSVSGISDGASVNWQQLLEAWAVPTGAAAVLPPPLEALLAEEDAAPLPQPPPAPLPPKRQLRSAAGGAFHPQQQPLQQAQRRQQTRPRRGAAQPALQSARSFRTQRTASSTAPALQPPAAAAVPACTAAPPAQPVTAPAASAPAAGQGASLPQQAAAQAAGGMPAIPVLRPPALQQLGPRKRGRPRVYDTITPGA